jgi:hypothetical protein
MVTRRAEGHAPELNLARAYISGAPSVPGLRVTAAVNPFRSGFRPSTLIVIDIEPC